MHRLPLRQLRLQQGLTQQEVASVLNVTKASVSHWELGQRQPSVDTAAQLASVLGCSLADVVNAIINTSRCDDGEALTAS